ncbi:polyribonucleotide nucleotidyltransferase [Patescibacteria group bacterium]
MKKIEKSIDFAGEKLTLASGHIAQQATGAIVATYGETVVFVSVVSQKPYEDKGYFPLQVEYEENLFAGGKIKGSKWVKRHGRPNDEEVLTARLIDRSIRPLFPKGYSDEVQVIIKVMSVDGTHQPDMVAAVATSAVVAISSIPWGGPVGTLRIGRIDDKFVTNPTNEQMDKSDLDLIVSSTTKAVVMVEAGANEITEADMAKAVEHAHKETQTLIKFINDFVSGFKVTKQDVDTSKVDSKIVKTVKELTKGKLAQVATDMATKKMQYADFDEMKHSVAEEFEDEEDQSAAKKVFEELFGEVVRDGLIAGKRPDGRKTDELRELLAEVGTLPRTHGTGLFQRGQTQALSVTTLANTSYEQIIETAEEEISKKYIHHYAMPPYSVGEAGRLMIKRREIGHGALAERAILPLLPSTEDFPYTIHVATEILSSNGSTSMASVCGSTLSLMDAGVPLAKPVAGIAMGVVISDTKNFKILTDIVGVEDGYGDMDFKVAGTKDGITALQLDVKTLNLTPEILTKALDQAKKARLEILAVMEKTIKTPNKKLSKYAPKIVVVKIDPEKIGELIGPGGKNIKGITEKTGAEVNVDDEGIVYVSTNDEEASRKAVEMVEAVAKEILPGELYDGEVVRIEPYGVFVQILGGRDGLVHVSDMAQDYVKDPNDIVKMGDSVKIRVKESDDRGRLSFSMILDPTKDKKKDNRGGGGGRSGGSGGRGGRSDRGRSNYNDRRGGRSQNRGRYDNRSRDQKNKSAAGPHFPASRLVDLDNKKR